MVAPRRGIGVTFGLQAWQVAGSRAETKKVYFYNPELY